MRVQKNYFDEPVAARYDEDSTGMFAAESVNPAVDFLAEIAGEKTDIATIEDARKAMEIVYAAYEQSAPSRSR